MRAETMAVRSMGLTFVYLLLLGFGMTFLAGCGNSLPMVGTVDKGQDPPQANGSQEQAKVNQNATQPVQGVPADMIPATANLATDDLDAAIKANKGWQLIDIREAREFAAGHISMALNRPLVELANNLAQISKDKDIILIDLNGARSEYAWRILVNKGYDPNKVKILTGGMLQWSGIGSAGNTAGSDSNNNSTSGSSNAAEAKPEVQEVVGGC